MATEEFIINTPSITDAKYWPGEMGRTANHCIVYAKLVTQGKVCGVQPFIVQVRDTQTHMPVPGVEMGDIGPKFGNSNKDNGYMIFKELRIPRDNLLRKFASVDKQGNYT